MVAGVASDSYPIFGSRRKAYLLMGALASLAGYALLATVVAGRGGYLAAMVLVTVGFMVQDVVADALSVEVARSDEEIAQVQALGRMALLAGGISVGYLSGRLAGAIGPRGVFAAAMILPLLVAGAALLVRPALRSAPTPPGGALGRGKTPSRPRRGARLRGARRGARDARHALRPGNRPHRSRAR